MSDTQLLQRIARGDRSAFSTFFDRHARIALGVLVRMLGRRHEAEEVLQEAFLHAWERAATYSPRKATPRGWLLLIARSRAIDRIRSRTARARREDAVSRDVWSSQVEPVGTTALEAADRVDTVRRALKLLPEEQRRCIELSFFEGLSHSQIAAALDAPIGTVKSRILLGMRKMRKAIRSAVSRPPREGFHRRAPQVHAVTQRPCGSRLGQLSPSRT